MNDDADKYLSRLDDVEKSSEAQKDSESKRARLYEFSRLRRRYKNFRERGEDQKRQLYFHSKIAEILKNPDTSREEISAYAHLLMEDALKESSGDRIALEGNTPLDLDYALRSAQMYEKIGKGKKAIPRLLKVMENDAKKGYPPNKHYIEKVRSFIERNAGKKQGSLEGRVSIFILSSIVGIALAVSSLTATGGVVSNLTNTTQGMLGIIFFVVGIAGLVFGRKG